MQKFILIFLLLPLITVSQNYFSKRYDYYNGAEFSSDIVAVPDGYILVENFLELNTNYYKILIFRLDSEGNKTGDPKIYFDTATRDQTGYPGSFKRMVNVYGYTCVGYKMK